MGINYTRNKGFTLIEVMIAIAIFGIVIGSAYSVMESQRKAATMQSEVVDMQQSLRTAMYYLEREIRLAGYPSNSNLSGSRTPTAGTGIIEAGPGHIRIAMDIFDGIDNDGDVQIDENDEHAAANPGQSFNDGLVASWNEDITFGFPPAYDADRDGIVDAGVSPPGTDPGAAPLGRGDNLNPPPPAILAYVDVAESIEAIRFAYAYDNDLDGQLDTAAGGVGIIWAIDTNGDGNLDLNLDTSGPLGVPDGSVDGMDAPGGVALNPPVPITSIRAVKVWVLARSKRQIPEHTETARTFVVGNRRITLAPFVGPGTGDRYLRRILTTTILCRNM